MERRKNLKNVITGQLAKLYLGLVVSVILVLNGEAYMVGDNPYRRVEKLDTEGKYILEWEVHRSSSRITFNVTVETTGYVGFGLSAKGKMSGADIVIGGVFPGGEHYFSDRHAVGNQLPEIDPIQNWKLNEAKENGTHTFLSFSRLWDTCDPQDYPIVEDKVSLIWSYGERDQLGYHYNKRGEYPVHLLNPDYTPPIDKNPQTNAPLVVHSPYNEDVRVWSWHMTDVIPRAHTTYWCYLRKGPNLSQKHHMIGIETRYNSEISARHLHHVIISKCRAPPGFSSKSLYEQYVNQGQLCYGAGGRTGSAAQEFYGPIRTEYCIDYLQIAAIGERSHFLAPQMGTPFGEEPDEYYLIQMHYDNPQELTGLKMDVNLDIYYTPQLRKNEGDLMVVRHETPGHPPSHLVPPSSIDQRTFGICGSDCSRKIFPKEGIRITSILLHAHNTGIAIRLRHFRNGGELSPVAIEDNFSPQYQQTRPLPREVRVLPGDQLVVECTQDNTWANGTVVGGYSTRQEMCVAWLFYYNKLPNHMLCASEVNSPEFMRSFLGIQNVTWSTPHLEYLATAPRNIAGLPASKVSDMLDWTIDKREELNRFLLTHPHSNRCPVEIYARRHTGDRNGDPVDLEPEENIPVLTTLPALTKVSSLRETCLSRRNNDQPEKERSERDEGSRSWRNWKTRD